MRWALLLVACSAPPAPPVARPAPPPAAKAGPPAPITCSDVGVILRGVVVDDRDAGPMKEAVIARACLQDAWSAELRTCIGDAPVPATCLAALAASQQRAYRKRLEAWAEAFPDETLDEAAADELAPYVACATAVGDAAQYAPVLTQPTGDARELAITLRRQQLLVLCEDWTNEARTCFDELKQPARCLAHLAPDQRQALADGLASVDALMAKVAAAKTPACKKVVDLHYADARWKGKLDALKPAEKQKIVIASRKHMLAACTGDKWTPSMRGCIAVGDERCFAAAGMTWGFPPSAVPIKTGIAACDAYGDALRALASCKQVPRAAVLPMLDALQQTAPAMLTMTADQRTAAASSCKQADSAIRQSAQSLGCTI